MSERLTKQGVRDLNPKGYNGRRHKYSDPVECQHNWQVGVVGEAVDYAMSYCHPVYGKKCLWCGEKRPAE